MQIEISINIRIECLKMYNKGKKLLINHYKNLQNTTIKHDMSYQNTSNDTVYKDYYQYNITMFFFYCDYVSEKKTHTQMNTMFFKV